MIDRSPKWTKLRADKVLNRSALRPGDVILSRPKGIESALIARFGKSVFSHAQLLVSKEWVHPAEANEQAQRSASELVILEATTDVDPVTNRLVGGIGFRELPIHYVRRSVDPVHSSKRALSLSSYVYFEVFRHIDADTDAFRSFAENSLRELCQKYIGQPYASLDDLAKAAGMSDTLRALADLLNVIPKSRRPGIFCSQLVSRLYEEGGFRISDVEHAYTRPKDISCSAALRCITSEVVFTPEAGSQVDTFSQMFEELFPEMIAKAAQQANLAPDEAKAMLDGLTYNDFGRTTQWQMRDTLYDAIDRTVLLGNSLDQLAAILKRLFTGIHTAMTCTFLYTVYRGDASGNPITVQSHLAFEAAEQLVNKLNSQNGVGTHWMEVER